MVAKNTSFEPVNVTISNKNVTRESNEVKDKWVLKSTSKHVFHVLCGLQTPRRIQQLTVTAVSLLIKIMKTDIAGV